MKEKLLQKKLRQPRQKDQHDWHTLVGSDRGLPFVKCVSQPAGTPVSFTLVEMKEKYEAEKQKNKALEDIKIKHKQNMERMTKIVGDYKSELD